MEEEEIKYKIELAEKIGRLEERVKTLEKDLDNNFKQHEEFYEMKKNTSLFGTIPGKVECLEQNYDNISGFVKALSWVGGIIAFLITAWLAYKGIK